MQAQPNTDENKRRDTIVRHQLRQAVNRQYRLKEAHDSGKHTTSWCVNCPKCNP